MRLKPSLSGLALAALLTTVLAGSAVAVAAGSPVTDVAQATNETATNATENGTTANATVGNLTVWTGSAHEMNLTGPAAVRAAKREGRLRRNASASRAETVVIEVPAPGLASAVGTANGSDSETDAFLRLVNGSSSYGFQMELTDDTTRPGSRRKGLNLTATRAADGFRAFADERNGTLFLGLRLDRAVLDGGYRSETPVDAGEAYQVRVTAGNTTATTVVEMIPPRLSFDTDAGSVVRIGVGQRCALVTGQAYPGADVEIHADLRNAPSGSDGVPVSTWTNESGRFAACINATELPQNGSLRLSAHDFRGAATGVFGHTEPSMIALQDQNATNGTVIADATLFEPGFVALYRAPSLDVLTPANESERCFPPIFGPVLDRSAAESRLIGASDRRGPGADTVPVELDVELDESARLVAVAHYDRDGDGRFDYPGADFPTCTSTGTPISDTASISPVEQSPSGSASANETATDAPPATARTASTTGDGPGFSPLVTALALVVIVLLARRR